MQAKVKPFWLVNAGSTRASIRRCAIQKKRLRHPKKRMTQAQLAGRNL
jgi:hypothetical protein